MKTLVQNTTRQLNHFKKKKKRERDASIKFSREKKQAATIYKHLVQRSERERERRMNPLKGKKYQTEKGLLKVETS